MKQMSFSTETILDWIALSGFKIASGIAGFFGGLISLAHEKTLTKGQKVVVLLIAATCAGYLTPLAGHYLKLSEQLLSGLGFLIGLMAMKLSYHLTNWGILIAAYPGGLKALIQLLLFKKK
ncbi:MAG: hypothetical protein HUU01_00540 [Saprospiraceae bacterium]|nr:hypothetical protein [Saprospiraceae bacterium]